MSQSQVESFITRWQQASGSERANYQLFLTELCQLLDLPRPDPASVDNALNAYVFERRVDTQDYHGDDNRGYIDLYKRSCFVLEAKQTGKVLQTSQWDKAMLRAHEQAVKYARALPAAEGRPPFVILTDVGRTLELYSEFSRSGGAYIPFPDPRSHRIHLEELRDETIRQRLQAVWTEPLALDPTRRSARVTREIAAQLAKLAETLEQSRHSPDAVAAFLMRCLFTMFAEDVGLLPDRGFTDLLESVRETPQHFPHLATELWQTMNSGGFSTSLRADLLRFNGGLFADPSTLELDREQIELLIQAARSNWKHVEPAIFGTLLERALDPRERHQLGAHYTPRAYVERLVMPTVIEPLRGEWDSVRTAAALLLDRQGKHKQALEQIRAFHLRLCQIRVLDPACGSGNFLYVTLEHLKRLEGEVLNTLAELGETQGLLELQGVSVDPHQMLGLETNPRAARIAEAVLWIGYLQWHFRTRGQVDPPQPVLRDFRNIECRDAVLAWDRIEFVTDPSGKPLTRWDGYSYKTHPVTGERVPDETARTPLEHYVNPRKAGWPEADFVVGNPPFIGTARMRQALGDGYAEALRKTYPRVPDSADFVMYWWHHAADLALEGKIERFGLITTNSLRQTFNRRVVQHHLEQKKPLSLVFAIPDHPWVDSADGAAVRIAMTVGEAGEAEGALHTVVDENHGRSEGREVTLTQRSGKLFADLKIGANVSGAVALTSNCMISCPGVKLHGSGFIVTPEQAKNLGIERIAGLDAHIRQYRNGRDLTQSPRGVMVIDLFGLTANEVRERYPEVYQWVYERVKPERDQNNRKSYRDNWWIFGEPRRELRPALEKLSRYIATVETSKHRFFVFLDDKTLPDNKLISIALEYPYHLGVLSSRLHILWSLVTGSRLGVGNDPVYVKTRCFETFPFPEADESLERKIRGLAEQIDAHRKRQQALHPGLTLTGMYNVLEKLRRIEAAESLQGAVPPPNPLPVGGGTGSSPHRGEAGRGERHTKLPLPPDFKAFARDLRGSLTDAEQLLWSALRKKQIAGVKFRRQHPIPPYVLDFYCDSLKLAVEVDGGQHNQDEERHRDRKRTEFLKSNGIRVLRFWNHEVLGETETVLGAIYSEVVGLMQFTGMAPPPNPLPRGEGTSADAIMLTEKEKLIHEQGLISVLGQLHDELDAAVLTAYHWSDLAPALVGKPGGTTPYPDKSPRQTQAEEMLLQRLVDLNTERAAEELQGLVRWLRPDFQNADGKRIKQGGQEAIETGQPVSTPQQPSWPKTIPAQVQAVREALAKQPVPTDAEQLARRFKRARTERVREVLETLTDLGQINSTSDGRYRL